MLNLTEIYKNSYSKIFIRHPYAKINFKPQQHCKPSEMQPDDVHVEWELEMKPRKK